MLPDLTNKTATEIDEIKCVKERELQEAQDNLYTIEIEELEIAKQIVELQAKRKDLQIGLSKAKQVVRTLRIDISILISRFWAAKNGGL
jgi:molybdopterin-biosynthesis enzyme MoeA-like protein